MSYTVYILYSLKDNKLYVGCTSDLTKRFERHQAGLIPATKTRGPFELVYSENYPDKAQAFNRERFLKSLWGSREKRKILKNYLAKSIRMAD